MRSSMRLMRPLLLCAVLGWSASTQAFDSFRVKALRVEGLERIAVGTVYNYLPVKVGDVMDEQLSSAAIHALFRTGFFRDVVLEREGDTLVVFVAERPAIASIELKGNSDIPTDQLTAQLDLIGFSEGRVFDRAMLDKVKQELERQYLALGKYNARIRSTVTPQERNRVAIKLEIAEGEVASIHHLNIVGNHAYSEKELTRSFLLGTDGGWFSDKDQYSKQKLAADLESLRSYYMDRGYINFDILSTQVSITPDKRHVYITINISEGEKYTVREVHIQGETLVPSEQLAKLVTVAPGDLFSRKKVTESTQRISDALGDQGYAFANINPIPEVDKEKREVALTYFVDPGKRVYVRRINLSGNVRTDDEVLRREMRQMEGGWISTSRVERSRTRLNRLGYFDDVSVKTPTVPGTPDQVDLEMSVIEQSTFGSFNFGLGYGDTQGVLINTSIDWQNFLGSGKKFSINFDNSEVNRVYSFNFTDPYSTIDGVSRTVRMYYRETNTDTANISNYTTDSYGASLRYGVPVSEYDTVRYGVAYENTKLNTDSSTSAEILEFCSDAATVEECQFDKYSLESGWTHDSRNRAVFPDRGGLLSLTGNVAVPVEESSLSFYKLRLNEQHFFPLTDLLTYSVEGEAAYADVYGASNLLAPYDRYFAGGIRSVRGFSGNSLTSTEGTRDSLNDPLGGNARLLGKMELQFPPPWDTESKSMRFMAFLDAGNVYNTDEGVDLGEIRYSTGLSMVWMTPVGPLTFSYAMPLNDKEGDDVEQFQFTLGTL